MQCFHHIVCVILDIQMLFIILLYTLFMLVVIKKNKSVAIDTNKTKKDFHIHGKKE